MSSLALFFAVLVGTSSTVIPRNDSLHITVSGSGQPVLLIPGLMGSAFGFRKVIARLDEAGYRSIVIEPLGFGSSGRPDDADYSMTAQADRIAAVLDSLVSEPVLVVAHSVGASIAYRMAFRHPRLVRGIVSLEGGPTESLTTPGIRTALKFAPILKLLGPEPLVDIWRRQMSRASADDGWITAEVIEGYTNGMRSDFGKSINALKAMSRVEEPESLDDRLGDIRCPVVLLIGAEPHQSGPRADDITVLLERVPNISVDSVAGAGHFLQEEAPDAVAAAIRALATSVPFDRVTASLSLPRSGSRGEGP